MLEMKMKTVLSLGAASAFFALLAANPALAQEAGEAASGAAMDLTPLAKGIAAGFAGLAVVGGGPGIGRIGGSACEAIARQPEAATTIAQNMILTAALIEGATLFAVLVGLLALFLI